MAQKAQAIPLPATTRRLIEEAIKQREFYQAMAQQQGQAIDALLAAAREMLAVPDGYVLINTAVGFEPPAQ